MNMNMAANLVAIWDFGVSRKSGIITTLMLQHYCCFLHEKYKMGANVNFVIVTDKYTTILLWMDFEYWQQHLFSKVFVVITLNYITRTPESPFLFLSLQYKSKIGAKTSDSCTNIQTEDETMIISITYKRVSRNQWSQESCFCLYLW